MLQIHLKKKLKTLWLTIRNHRGQAISFCRQMTLVNSNILTILQVCSFANAGCFCLSYLESRHPFISNYVYACVHSFEACVFSDSFIIRLCWLGLQKAEMCVWITRLYMYRHFGVVLRFQSELVRDGRSFFSNQCFLDLSQDPLNFLQSCDDAMIFQFLQ